MPLDLPQYKSDTVPPRRPRANKRTLAALAVVGIFFLFFLNARVSNPETPSSSSVQEPSINDPSLPTADSGKSQPQSPVIIEEEQEHGEPSNYDPDFFPALENDDPNSEAANILPDQELFPTENQREEEIKGGDNAVSPHSNQHSTLPHPLAEENQDDIILNDSNHYTYLVVIASQAIELSRRQLIREKYFGLVDNLLPCMHYNTDMLYKFWIYGDMIPAKTDDRRRYEAEKMEWNDLEEVGKGVKYEQISILEWVKYYFCIYIREGEEGR